MRNSLLVSCLVLFWCCTVCAETINYDDLTNASSVPAGYGSSALVSVTHRSLVDFGNAAALSPPDNLMRISDNGYGSLTDDPSRVAFGGETASTPQTLEVNEISFLAVQDYLVTLASFDLAAFQFDQNTEIRYYDAAYNLLLPSSGNVSIPGDPGVANEFVRFTPNLTSETVRLQWSNGNQIAIDNINFSTSVVPEPASLILVASGTLTLVLIGLGRRRRPVVPGSGT